ncbi:unnamed protein product [Lactuca virosa]|uniref:Uncharacterized protein n=1 Tax=Lactuca virosa TaxID=75947 RepID=A0AAU9P0T9_9ASTR|nr:unnamed protein product [Lactuca virosa]
MIGHCIQSGCWFRSDGWLRCVRRNWNKRRGLRSEVVREGVRLSEREFGWTGTDEGSSLINKVIQRHNQPEKQKNKGTNVQFFLPQILENGWQAWLVASMKA